MFLDFPNLVLDGVVYSLVVDVVEHAVDLALVKLSCLRFCFSVWVVMVVVVVVVVVAAEEEEEERDVGSSCRSACMRACMG